MGVLRVFGAAIKLCIAVVIAVLTLFALVLLYFFIAAAGWIALGFFVVVLIYIALGETWELVRRRFRK